jgi:hypothetical protein
VLIDPAILPLGLFSAAAVVILLQLLTSPFRMEPPQRMRTLGDISRRLAGLSAATRPVSSESEVYVAVQSIVSDILGVEPHEVIPEARFVQDLGMG